MELIFAQEIKNTDQVDLNVLSSFQSKESNLNSISKTNPLSRFKSVKNFKAEYNQQIMLTPDENTTCLINGLGDKTKLTNEKLRRNVASLYKSIKAKNYSVVAIDADSFFFNNNSKHQYSILIEAILLADYTFEKYKLKKNESKIKKLILVSKKISIKEANEIFEKVNCVTESINFARDLINEVPNVLYSTQYAKIIEQDVKENLKNVSVKILNKEQIKKEQMNLLLSVNAGSAHEPRVVHLTYQPKKMSKTSKHIALVGKGITFDTGGYSLKPGDAMAGMKFDMGGSATVYAAFRAAVLAGSENKITCIMAITDNAVNSNATFPDSVITGRNGKTVEILNTDAEGRLILADALDYACDQKPDAIIDAATLTGACLIAFGKEVCAMLGNDEKLIKSMKASAEEVDEYLWQLPIIQEYRDDIKSKVAEIKNIGSPRMAGTAIGAVFLEHFIKNDIAWVHLDIAGVCEAQSHLPYCPPHGASGVMVRTIYNYVMNV